MLCNPVIYVRPGLLISYHTAWLSTNRLVLEALERELRWNQGFIRLFGREIPEPRLTGWAGDVDYTYSGRVLEARPWCESLRKLRVNLNSEVLALTRTQVGFNHCLVNWYRSGTDSMGWNQDNEPVLGESPVVASVSLGDRRRFRVRHKSTPKLFGTLVFELGEGDLLLMYGQTQHVWEHELPKTSRKIHPRMNLTFRSIAS